jgi:hypothetical protein
MSSYVVTFLVVTGAMAGSSARVPKRVAGDPPHHECIERTPPLFEAIAAKNVARVRALLEQGADVNVACDYGEGGGEFPLDAAFSAGSKESVLALLDAGARLRHLHTASPLERAIELGWEDVVDRLLQAGADVNEYGHAGPVFLHAVRQPRLQLVQRLLAAGADPNVHYLGKSALDEASTPEIKERLRAAGARTYVSLDVDELLVKAARRGNVGELEDISRHKGGGDLVRALAAALEDDQREAAAHLATGLAISDHPKGCDVLVLAARRGHEFVVASLLITNPNIDTACLIRAREASVSRGPGSNMARLLSAYVPRPPPSRAAPSVVAPSPRKMLLGIGASLEGGWGGNGPVGAVELSAARGRSAWLAGELAELAAGYSFNRSAFRLRVSYGAYLAALGLQAGAVVHLPAGDWRQATSLSLGVGLLLPEFEGKPWMMGGLHLEVGLDGRVSGFLRLTAWHDFY